MIPEYCITSWRQEVSWPEDYQVEQDLIISKALVNLYERPLIKENLAFRGGTALNKLYLKPAARYSEDIDFVQIYPAPIGTVINEIRLALDNWLGKPARIFTERSVKLTYRYLALDGFSKKLKVEINTTEHFNMYGFIEHELNVDNPWFTSSALLQTYCLDELIGTKLRALYQRRKGRDLFDLWIVLKDNMIDCERVIHAFTKYCKNDNLTITRSDFEKNLKAKLLHHDFQNDVHGLIIDKSIWSIEEAIGMVKKKLIHLLP